MNPTKLQMVTSNPITKELTLYEVTLKPITAQIPDEVFNDTRDYTGKIVVEELGVTFSYVALEVSE